MLELGSLKKLTLYYGLIIIPVILIIEFAIKFNFAKKNSEEQKKYNNYMKICIIIYIACLITTTILTIFFIKKFSGYTLELFYYAQASLIFMAVHMPFISLVLIILSFIMYLNGQKCDSDFANEYKKTIKMFLISSLISLATSLVFTYVCYI